MPATVKSDPEEVLMDRRIYIDAITPKIDPLRD
jgi:hypothetical protein